jgi:hypothetical protein
LSATQSPKWLNLSWDAFKQVENHNKSHIFATMKENRGKRGISDEITDFNPTAARLDIDLIKDRLKERRYQTMEEFAGDMNSMFQAWLEENGETHKYFLTF